MRLSTAADRDETRALAVIHAALDAGVTLVDTADAYARDDADFGHNERLVARALARWQGERSAVRIATKGGLTRPGGRWVEDGRAKHLAAACEASRRALGVARIDLYQLHAPDPRTPLATSLRALQALKRDGHIAALGLCNVTLGQLEEALGIAEIASVQVEMNVFEEKSFRNGVAEHCLQNGIELIAHRPLGGAARRRRLEQDPLLRELAEKHAATPQLVALAWLLDLSPRIVPIPGPTSVEHASALRRVLAIRLDDEDRARLDARFPAGRMLRTPRAERRPPAGAAGEVVIVMGLPAAGKSTLARDLVERGYLRLNRDDAGGRLADLLPALDRALGDGRREVVLDNTYGSRAARNAVIETAWRHGVPARCVWLRTSLEEAQVNAVERMLARYGRLLSPEDLKSAGKSDPGAFAPNVLHRHQRELEPPDASEGFERLDSVAFERRPSPQREGRAVLLWYDGVVRGSRCGARRPASPDDVVLLPGRAETLHRWHADGFRLLGLAWHPELAAGHPTTAQVEAALARTGELLGVPIDALYCPHADGPPVCWCRKPLPGLGVALVLRHGLDPRRCVYVGQDASDQALARRLGFEYRTASEFFA